MEGEGQALAVQKREITPLGKIKTFKNILNYPRCIKEIKNAPSALLSYMSKREFLRT